MQRPNSLRRLVAALTITVFLAAFAGLSVQMASGDDPALSRGTQSRRLLASTATGNALATERVRLLRHRAALLEVRREQLAAAARRDRVAAKAAKAARAAKAAAAAQAVATASAQTAAAQATTASPGQTTSSGTSSGSTSGSTGSSGSSGSSSTQSQSTAPLATSTS